MYMHVPIHVVFDVRRAIRRFKAISSQYTHAWSIIICTIFTHHTCEGASGSILCVFYFVLARI